MKPTLQIRFRPDEKKMKALDSIAHILDRDRNDVINEAISAYIDLYRWQIKHIKKGIQQANSGQFAPEEEVNKILRRKAR